MIDKKKPERIHFYICRGCGKIMMIDCRTGEPHYRRNQYCGELRYLGYLRTAFLLGGDED